MARIYEAHGREFSGGDTPAYDFNRLFYARLDPNRSDGHGQTFLHEMCREGNLSAIETLTCIGGSALDFKAPDLEGSQPIHEAAKYGHEDILIYLNAVRGISIESETYDGRTPLYIAAEGGNMSIVRRLIEFGARLNTKESRCGYTPLHAATKAGSIMIVGSLIAAGANVFAKDYGGQTAYDLAQELSYLDTAKLLCKVMMRQAQGSDFDESGDSDTGDNDECNFEDENMIL